MKNFKIIFLLLIISYYSFGQKTILWKVTDTINNKSSTIVGTFHQFGNSFVDSIPEIEQSLLKSELAIYESIDKVEQTQKMINSREKSFKIENVFNKNDFTKLLEISENWKVDIYKLKPIELRWKLQQEFQKIKCKTVASTDKWDHFDNYLQFLATQNKIDILGLETDKQQLGFISKEYKYPNWKDERKNIRNLIRQLTRDSMKVNDCSFTNKYRTFDLDYNFDGECNFDVFIKQRNQNWMTILPNLIKEKDCFIAVGYMHLRNKCGLLEQLRKKGFLIEPIILKPAGNKG